jgi:hypothetical protein
MQIQRRTLTNGLGTSTALLNTVGSETTGDMLRATSQGISASQPPVQRLAKVLALGDQPPAFQKILDFHSSCTVENGAGRNGGGALRQCSTVRYQKKQREYLVRKRMPPSVYFNSPAAATCQRSRRLRRKPIWLCHGSSLAFPRIVSSLLAAFSDR